MKFYELLNESLSKEVYHYTNRIIDILETNKFKLTSSLGTSADDNLNPKKKFYFMSVSRVKFGGYTRSNTSKYNSSVVLVLNGDKLNQKYHAKPVDYWGREFRKDKRAPKDSRLSADENEERLFSDKPEIPNASSYIKEIHVWNYSEFKKLSALTNLADAKGIPLYFHKDINTFKTLNKTKSQLVDRSLKSDIGEIINFIKTGKLVHNSTFEKAKYSIDYHKGDKEKIKKDFYFKEAVTILKNDIHNNKTTNREKINKLVEEMKKLKTRTVEDFLIKVFK